MAITGRIFSLAAALGLLLAVSPAFAQSASAGTGSDASFMPTIRPTHSVPKPPKAIPVQHRIKKPKPAAPIHS